MSIIHPANLKAPSPDSPDPHVPVPSHLAGEILIEGIPDDPILTSNIGLESCSKGGVLLLIPVVIDLANKGSSSDDEEQ